MGRFVYHICEKSILWEGQRPLSTAFQLDTAKNFFNQRRVMFVSYGATTAMHLQISTPRFMAFFYSSKKTHLLDSRAVVHQYL